MSNRANNESRAKQMAVAAIVLAAVFVPLICLILFWRYIPGWLGESLGMFAGLISSPFILEGFFLIMGFFLVIFINSWRRKSGGGDFLEFDASDFEKPQDPEERH